MSILYRWKRFALSCVGLLSLFLVGMVAYGFVLWLPFFSDDMVHFRWLEWHNLLRIWGKAYSLGYYRPLPFTIWKILYYIQGGYDSATLHAINLALHLFNGVLVLALVVNRHQQRHLLMGLGAALLFLLFPFSYQAVPWVGSLTHPLVTSLILGAILLHQISRRRRSRFLKAISVALAFSAPFANETGVLIAPLLVLSLLTEDEPLPIRKMIRTTGPYWLCAMVGLGIWFLMKEVKIVGIQDIESRWQNGTYFAQGFAYPVSPFATKLLQVDGRLSDLQAVSLVTIPVILVWSVLLWKMGQGRWVAFALGWFVISIAPAWLMLGFSYVIDGPRLLYEASVGAAIFWAIPLSVRWHHRRIRTIGPVLAALTVLATSVEGYRFIRDRALMYEEIRRAVHQIVEAVRPLPISEEILCVNYPLWFAPLKPTFALGHEGVPLVGGYVGINDLLWLHTGKERNITGVVLPDLLTHWRYHYASFGTTESLESIQAQLRKVRNVLLADYRSDHITIYNAGGLEAEGREPARMFVANFDGKIGLLSASSKRDGSVVEITLQWQCWEEVDQEVTVFVHLCSEDGELVAQADGYPVMNMSRPAFWKPGDVWRDVRILRLPANATPGLYFIKVGLYPRSGERRLLALDSVGQRYPDDAVPIGFVEIP